MKRVACMVVICSLPALALKTGEARYYGGTAPDLKSGIVCRLVLSSNDSLVLESGGQRLAIPYTDIEGFQYSRELKWHFGVLPAIAIGLFRVWPRQHFFRITFHDQHHITQVVVLELPKSGSRVLQAVLEAREPHPCAVPTHCGTRNSTPSCTSLQLPYIY